MIEKIVPVRCGCGGYPVLCKGRHYEYYWVECSRCGIGTIGKTHRGQNSEAEAVEMWNNAMGAKWRPLIESWKKVE